jgi:poly(3-hydroxybutyrate) depolymerase
VLLATAGGTIEVHRWERGRGGPVQLTDRPQGTVEAAIDPTGDWVWWFDDSAGNEQGVWRRQPFGSGPGQRVEAATDLPSGFSAGLALGRRIAVIGRTDSTGSRIYAQPPGGPTRLVYDHAEDARVGALSEDETLLAVQHSEPGDARHPAVRVLRLAGGAPAGELWDGPGKGVRPLSFRPVPGDQRLLVLHERRGRPELLVWNVAAGTVTELDLGLPGEVGDADWVRGSLALLVAVDHEARTRLHRVELDGSDRVAAVTAVGPADGTALATTSRPGGDAWVLWSSAAQPPSVRDLAGALVLAPPGGRPAPPSVPAEDVWVDGPGGRVHGLLRRPAATDGRPLPVPLPLVVDVHGGPASQSVDAYRAGPSAWVDHGFAVVQVNYRGSTGYGSAWRDALEDRVGHVELEDVVAVRDHLVAAGVADPERVVLSGTSWGGYLTLLGLGTYPDRWAAGLAGAPVADFISAYQDEADSLRAYDRSLFGGTPADVPDKYRDSSPISYAAAVRAPVLILAGVNDPRCPIRQIERYVDELTRLGKPHELLRYDAGHGSLLDDERVRQMRARLEFVHRHLGPAAGR